jgi:hypothetical protein
MLFVRVIYLPKLHLILDSGVGIFHNLKVPSADTLAKQVFPAKLKLVT